MNNSHYEITIICDEIKSMLLDKNMKYGDSALNPIRIMSQSDSVEQIKVRIDDKLSRLSQGNVDDDEDVINDLIGYFILLKIAKQNQNVTNEETSDDYEHSEYYYDFDRNGRISVGTEDDYVKFWNKTHTTDDVVTTSYGVDKTNNPSYNKKYSSVYFS